MIGLLECSIWTERLFLLKWPFDLEEQRLEGRAVPENAMKQKWECLQMEGVPVAHMLRVQVVPYKRPVKGLVWGIGLVGNEGVEWTKTE